MSGDRTVGEFSEIFNGPEMPLIVGGMAVNVWSEYYIEHPEVGKKIREYDTFTSDDLDLFCDIQMAQAIAVRINAKFKREKPREITRAYIISHDREGSEWSLSILADILLAKTMLRSSISVCSNGMGLL